MHIAVVMEGRVLKGVVSSEDSDHHLKDGHQQEQEQVRTSERCQTYSGGRERTASINTTIKQGYSLLVYCVYYYCYICQGWYC